MKRRALVAAGAVFALVAAFVGGRFSAPLKTKVETRVETRVETQIEWRDRIVEKRVEGPVREVERIIEKPGAEREIVRWIERGPVTTDTTSDLTGTASASTESSSATSRVSEAGRPGWAAGLAATWDPGRLSSMPDRLGLELDRRIVGTLWLGVRASATSTFAEPQIGAALRLEF